MKPIVILMVITFLAGCTWVKLDEAGQNVSVLNPDEAESCKSVGKVTAISRAKVAGITAMKETTAFTSAPECSRLRLPRVDADHCLVPPLCKLPHLSRLGLVEVQVINNFINVFR